MRTMCVVAATVIIGATLSACVDGGARPDGPGLGDTGAVDDDFAPRGDIEIALAALPTESECFGLARTYALTGRSLALSAARAGVPPGEVASRIDRALVDAAALYRACMMDVESVAPGETGETGE